VALHSNAIKWVRAEPALNSLKERISLCEAQYHFRKAKISLAEGEYRFLICGRQPDKLEFI